MDEQPKETNKQIKQINKQTNKQTNPRILDDGWTTKGNKQNRLNK